MDIKITINYEELIRINPQNSNELQSKSTGMGACWSTRYSDENVGKFIDLKFDPDLYILVATTDKGIFYSANGGRNWYDMDEE